MDESSLALVFLVLALIGGVLGCTGVARQSLYFAKMLFLIFLANFIVGLAHSMMKGKRPRVG